MSQSNCRSTAGQDGVFHVVLLDAQGEEQGYIGYRFGAAGAQAAANSWNAQPERTLTAVIRDGVPVVKAEQPAAQRLSITTGKAEQFVLPTFCTDDDLEFYRDLLADAEQVDIVTDCAVPSDDDDTEDDDGCYIVILNDCGTWFLVNDEAADHDWADEWVRTWHHDHAQAIVVDADDLGDVENMPTLSKRQEARANAFGQDSDSDIESDHEHAAGANVAYDLERTVRAIRAGGIREALKVHLHQVIDSLEHVFDCGDVGVIARSLEAFSEAMGAASEYSNGADGGWVNEELIEALGLESNVPA